MSAVVEVDYGYFTFKLNKDEKILDSVVSGTFTDEMVEVFLDNYTKLVSSIDPKEYLLRIDCNNLDVLTQEAVPNMDNCARLYIQTGFERITVLVKDNSVLKMQLNRIFKNAGLHFVEIQEVTIEELDKIMA